VSRFTAKLLILFLFIVFQNKQIYAYEASSTSSAVVSATILSTSFSPPILIAPNADSTTNNAREPLVWKRPSPLPSTPLHHYDVYLDGAVFAYSVSDSITTPQTYYFYTVTRDGDTFYLNFLTDLSQGYHTWSVTAYDTFQTNAASETRTFYVDSISPFIKLEKVDRQTLNWDTANPSSIPAIEKRSLTVTTSSPLLKGSVEPYANMEIILMCPQNIPVKCQNQSWEGNYPTGTWQHRFNNLISGLIYTVYITATDAGGNSTVFPEFFLAHGIVKPTPTATVTPIISPTPEISISPVPEVTPEIEVIPTPYIPTPPASPTPPLEAQLVKPKISIVASNWFLLLLVFGLPLHLFMALLGTKTRISVIPKFLFILLFPFFGKKEYQTAPFVALWMFDPDKLDSPWQTKIADVKGFYNLTSPLLEKIFVKMSCLGRFWKNTIILGNILPSSCLFPILVDPQTGQDRLQKIIMRLRSLPLIVACLSSGYAMVVAPNYFYLIYLYLSGQYAFSEYLYPHLQ